MPKYILYPYYTDESATCWGTPVAEIDTLPPEGPISHELLIECTLGLQKGSNGKSKTREELMAMTDLEIVDFWDKEHILHFDKIAVIEDIGERRKDIDKFSEMLLAGAGDDSSAYAAADAFGGYLESVAEVVLDVPPNSWDIECEQRQK